MRITDIKKTKAGRYALFIDGRFLFSLHRDTYLASGLAVGAQLERERLKALWEEDQNTSAKDKAFALLAHSARSRGGLAERLSRDYDPDAVEQTVVRMEELGLIDDLDYGRRLAADLVNLRGYSLRRVRFELEKRRLSAEDIEEVLRDYDPDESEQIARILMKKYWQKLSMPDGVRKAVAAMQRQGFGYGDVKTALRLVQAELSQELETGAEE